MRKERIVIAPPERRELNRRVRERKIYRGSELTSLTPKLEARILSWTRKTPPDGSTHWSTRRLAKHLGINHMLVHRAWKRAGYSPHRIERYVASKVRT